MQAIVKRNILLNPGPVTTTDTVKQAMLVSDICHRELEFTEILRSIRQDLLKVVNAGDDFTSVLFTASGTGAVEACINSVVSLGKKLLVINNGSYGSRMIDIANRYRIPVVEIKFAFDSPIPLDKIRAALQADPEIQYVAMVHHETSSGILNALQPVGEICDQYRVGLIVDAMSSFAGKPIDVNQDHIDFLISSSNKCLHGMPGISFVIAKKDKLLESKNQARSFYFDLYQQYYSLETTGQMPFTPAIQVAYAFRQALDEYFQETAETRMQRYRDNYRCLMDGLISLGFQVITPKHYQSELLVTVQFPDDARHTDFDQLHDYLYEQGFTIYPKKLPINNTFRLACLGDLNQVDIENFIKALEAYGFLPVH